MTLRRFAAIYAIASITACGFGSTGLLVDGPEGGRAGDDGPPYTGGGDSTADDSSQGEILDGAQASVPDAAYIGIHDASADKTGAAPVPLDAEVDGLGGDGGSCAQLMQCCNRLLLTPPLAAACLVSERAADGGEASCASSLAKFRSSGLCM
jgi:hypothetical protein